MKLVAVLFGVVLAGILAVAYASYETLRKMDYV